MAPEFSGRPAKPITKGKAIKEARLTPLEIAQRSFAYWEKKATALRNMSQDDSEAIRHANRFRARIEALQNAPDLRDRSAPQT